MRTKISLVVGLILMLSLNLFGDVDLENGLVAHYPFNGNADDESENENNGIENGVNLTEDRFDNINSAYDFDGIDDFISIPHSVDFNFGSGQWSISGWYKFDELDNIIRLITKRSSSSPYQGIYLKKLEDNKITIQAGDYNNPSNHQYLMIPSIIDITVIDWYHIVMQRTETQIELWVDNNLENTSNLAGWNWNVDNNNPTIFGANRDTDDCFHSGKIDDIRFYNRALNEEEIQELYQFNPTPISQQSIPELPNKTALHSAFPNPFNPKTTIKFSVQESETANFEIFNLKGQIIKSYPIFNAGNHEVNWIGTDNNGNKVSSGVFFYKLKSESVLQVQKMLLLK